MWLLYALLASLFWGLEYTLTEKVLKEIAVSTLLSIELLFGFVGTFAIAFLSGAYSTDLHIVLSSKRVLLFMGIIVLSFIIGCFLIVTSIGAKNATLAGLIEISYPLFIASFTWLLFKENNVHLGTILGAGLVFLGISLIYYFNR